MCLEYPVDELQDTAICDLVGAAQSVKDAMSCLNSMTQHGLSTPDYRYLKTCYRQLTIIKQELEAIEHMAAATSIYQIELPF